MTKINIYLPDRLAEEVKNAGVPVSAVCQRALERVVRDMAPVQAQLKQPSSFGIYGRFLQRARISMELAYDAAARRGHYYIGSEHILLGILEQGSNLAVHMIESLSVSPDELILKVNDFAPVGTDVVHNEPYDRLLTDGAKKALSLATREAARLDHNYIGTEHLLYGLVAEDEGIAAQILKGFGVTEDAVRRTHKESMSAWIAVDWASFRPSTQAADLSQAETQSQGEA
jgi:ATP-dependent Clp protease ATP-binding subunit ClpC